MRAALRTNSPRSVAASLAVAAAIALAGCGESNGQSATEPEPTTTTTTQAASSTTTTTQPAAPTTTEVEPEPAAPTGPYAGLALHAGYWIIDEAGPIPTYDNRILTSISVHHVDIPTRRMTVYSQSTLPENANGTGAAVAISPPQLDPGTCDADPLNGQTVCAHANAVYLDGSGQEQTASTGEGTWWIKHSWILDGDGYRNCPAMPPPTELRDEDTDCTPAIGVWQNDDLTMHVGFDLGTGEVGAIYNVRRPLLDRDPVAYFVDRIDPRPDAVGFTIEFRCVPDQPSPLDDAVLGCPAPTQRAG